MKLDPAANSPLVAFSASLFSFLFFSLSPLLASKIDREVPRSQPNSAPDLRAPSENTDYPEGIVKSNLLCMHSPPTAWPHRGSLVVAREKRTADRQVFTQ